ncbi:MAG: hypothetical protein ACXVRW_16450 [Solirubrobacteraceae bacterium]
MADERVTGEAEAATGTDRPPAVAAAGPTAAGPAAVQALQRAAGNRAVAALAGNPADGRRLQRLGQGLPYVGPALHWLEHHVDPTSIIQDAVVGRPLTADEKKILDDVFGNALATSIIRIRENSTIIGYGNCHRTTGNIINTPGVGLSRKDLIHEASHVWQHQNGIPFAYAASALSSQAIAQLTQGDWEKAYDYSGLEGKVPWALWNAEQQAHWIEDHGRLPPNWWWEGPVASAVPAPTP